MLPSNASRPADFRSGTRSGGKRLDGYRLGRCDRLVTWTKPKQRLTAAEWSAVPDTLQLRQLKVTLTRNGFRSKTIVVVTTLADASEFTPSDLGELYALRWEIELDLRSNRVALGTAQLRCRTPAMLRRELCVFCWRTTSCAASAAERQNLQPRDLSLTGALQTPNAFLPAFQSGVCDESVLTTFLWAIAIHRVGNRPGRQEPRKIKRRQKHDSLTQPGDEARKTITRLKPCRLPTEVRLGCTPG